MRPVPVKHLSEADRPALERHFLKLDPEDLRLRFGSLRNAYAIGAYVAGIDFARDAVFGVFDETLEIEGAAHLALPPEGAELGISVLTSGRGKGLGTALLDRAHAHARNAGLRVIYVHFLSENQTMMHIARKAGMRIHNIASESNAWMEVPKADAETLAKELLDERVALLDYELKARRLAAAADGSS